MLESFMRNICEHIRGLIPSMSNVGQITKLIIDIGVVVTAGVLIFVFAEFTEYDLELAIVQSWGICAAALAAPLMCTLMYRNATRSGMYAGIAAGVAVYVIWQFIPAVGGTSIGAYLGISGDVAGFTASMIFCIAVSMFTPKNREDELRVFDRMKADQA